jgi:HK97 family phage major capsid protein
MQLLQDSATNLDTYVPARLGERIGRIVNERLTIGTGTDMPNGIVNAPTTPAAAAAEIEYADLLDMEHSVDPSYRRQGAQYMFNDMTLKAIKELQDNENRPLWLPSVRAGDPDRILGRTYVINQDYADIGTGNVSMSFGLLTKYVARQVNQVVMMRLTERYAEFLQVGFLGFQRWDGDILDAGTNPIKGLLHP